MTYPKMKPCPICGQADTLEVYKYENGWQHVECDLNACGYMGPGEGSILQAIRSHNEAVEQRNIDAPDERDGGRG